MSKFKVGDRVRMLPPVERMSHAGNSVQSHFEAGQEFTVSAVSEAYGGYVVGPAPFDNGVYDGNIELAAEPVNGLALLGVNDSVFTFTSLDELYSTLSVLYAKSDKYQEFIITKADG